LRGVVFDLPDTVRDESSFGDRCVFVAGNSFDSVPEGDALFAGRERDERQWRELLGGAGFEVVRIGGVVIEARCR